MPVRSHSSTLCAVLALLLTACGGGGGGTPVPPGVDVYATGKQPEDLALGDFDSDGFVDVAVANYLGDTSDEVVTLFAGDGSGALAPGVALAPGCSPSCPYLGSIALASGKLDSGTTDDLVVAYLDDSSYTVALGGFPLSSISAGARTPFAGLDPQAVTLADFDGGGTLDLAVALSGSDRIDILSGDGTGGFALAATVSTGYLSTPWGVAAGDIDGGDTDLLAVTVNTPEYLTAFSGPAFSGLIPAATATRTPTDAAVAVGQFDTDPKADVVTVQDDENRVLVFRNGALTSPLAYAVGTAPADVAVGEVTNDAFADIITADFGSNTVTILAGDGTGGFALAETVAVPAGPAALAVGDLNGNGVDDILTVHPDLDWLSVILR